MKKIITAVVLVVFAIFGLSARGMLEEQFTGNVSFTVNDAGETVVVLVTADGSYVLNIPEGQLAGLDLAEGQEITVEGELLDGGEDGEDEVNVRIVTVDDRRYKVELEDIEEEEDDDGNDEEDSPSYDDVGDDDYDVGDDDYDDAYEDEDDGGDEEEEETEDDS